MKNYTQYFETKKRDGNNFIAMTNNAPELLREFVKSVHLDYFDGCLPNEWIYHVIDSAFFELEDNDIDDITIEADPYYYDLKRWFQEPFAMGICDDYQDEFLEEKTRIIDLISGGQWLAKDRIYRVVDQFMQDNEVA